MACAEAEPAAQRLRTEKARRAKKRFIGEKGSKVAKRAKISFRAV